LNYAIRELQTDVVLFLLELGADPNRVPVLPPGYYCLSPMRYARTLVDDNSICHDNSDARRILNILEKHVTRGQAVS
jgi:hypothetical protein